MTYENFKNELEKIVLKDITSCGYISSNDEFNDRKPSREHSLKSLNPIFGYSTGGFFGVERIWWDFNYKGDFRFVVNLCNRNYKDVYIEENDKNHTLTEVQRDKIIEYVRQWYEKKLENMKNLYERGKKEISIEDLQNECEKVANEILKGKTDRSGDKLRARLSVGKRQCDTNSNQYTALCIEYYNKSFGWGHLASFTFGKNKFGINQMTYRKPLGGETSMEFNWDTFKSYIQSLCK